jgi:uncharacterized protein Smg (DUF494 family)
MKNLFYFYTTIITITFSVSGCVVKESTTCHKHILVMNNYNKDIYIGNTAIDSDTILPYVGGILSQKDIYKTQSAASNDEALRIRGCYESEFQYIRKDTIVIFLFDAYTLENNAWDTIVKRYMVLQRYDLSLQDLQKLEWMLPFPPTETMKHMRMYPPYGTYSNTQ